MWSTPVSTTIVYAPVLVTGVAPKLGPMDGGSTVVLTGSGFKDVTNVRSGPRPRPGRSTRPPRSP